ncbi:alpha/beta fold hydrolase [uncultured Brevundimonas sp.]|uniref:alpha/beta fold hydrolase n=1 Tax=uncultured Brevundimonas sp. TaxID=213418 RepID=UPI0025DCCC40|nr:alpha/beta fold hydrolase [uncultured Brevundimonas sp.]
MKTETFRGFGGVVLSVERHGSPEDPGVVLVHTGGQSAVAWRQTAEALVAAGRHVLCPDLRGHGRSARPADGRYDLDAYAEDLRALLRALPTRPVIVGVALGAAIALAAIADDGAHLAAGVVTAGVAPDLDPEAVRRLARDPRPDEGADPRWTTGLDMATLQQTLESVLGQVRLPLLILHGADNRLVSLEARESMARRAPNARHVEIEGASHDIAADQPERFQALLLEFLETEAPRDPMAYQSGSDVRTLRDALGCFGTGVTVVTTTDGNGTPVGLTANSFTSVSLAPPLLLFCLARSAGSLAAFEASSTFAVNVLHIGQQPTSDRFARPGEDRFAETAFEPWHDGVPALVGSLAVFLCRKHAVHDGGDHRIFVGEVIRARFEPRRDPLLYFRGRYRRLHFA